MQVAKFNDLICQTLNSSKLSVTEGLLCSPLFILGDISWEQVKVKSRSLNVAMHMNASGAGAG